jgi:hypothetical protein
MELERLLSLMAYRSVDRVLVKVLSANDNSKQQVYAGPGFEALNIFPNRGIERATSRVGGAIRPRFYARVDFSWLLESGEATPAPEAKLILYPRYPEVRLSGFLRRAPGAPSAVLTSREEGRVLFIGVRDADGALFGFAGTADSLLRRQLDALGLVPQVGVFRTLNATPARPTVDWRTELLSELGRVAALGWIYGKRMSAPSQTVPCDSLNCGGFTLEAELGIVANAFAEPDYHGWELKAHGVRDLVANRGGPITLLTHEPTAGYYATAGFRPFMRRHGYADRRGRPDRLNFGGIYRVGHRVPLTGLTMKLQGFDPATDVVDLVNGQLALVDDAGAVALAYPISQLLDHWSVKHALCAYVPYVRDAAGAHKRYRYGHTVRLASGTDGLRLIRAIHEGVVYYDPAPKLENASGPKPVEKRRNQLRVASADIGQLYSDIATEVV